MMVAWFHPGFDMEHDRYSGDNIWLREHLYVAASRARFRTIVVAPGGLDALARMVAQCSRPRDTSVKTQLAQHMPAGAYTSRNHGRVEAELVFNQPRESLVVMPKSVPCAPPFRSASAAKDSDGEDNSNEV